MIENIDRDTRRRWHEDQLKWSLQALALPSEEQLVLFPDFVCKSDELALDFDDARRVVVDNYEDELSQAQRDALDAVGRRLMAMSKHGREFSEELWTDDAVRADARWASLRALASEALRAFGWAVEAPPHDPRQRGAMYVRGA